MAQCKKLYGRYRQICVGSMDRLITLKNRVITKPSHNSVDYTETFANIAEVWAQALTVSRGEVFFDGVNILGRESHIWGIYYRDDVTSETWLELDGANYDILSVENLEERDEFLLLHCMKKGDKTLAANQT